MPTGATLQTLQCEFGKNRLDNADTMLSGEVDAEAGDAVRGGGEAERGAVAVEDFGGEGEPYPFAVSFSGEEGTEQLARYSLVYR